MAAPEPPPAANGLMTWPDLLERPRPEPTATISYGKDSLQVVDLWRPGGAGPHPTVLMVHGGCWQTGIADRRIMNWIADDLRKRGIAVWNIDYRGVDRDGGGYPGTFLDAAAAADALRDAAPKHGLDLSRLVAVGHSAGGHLALWLAARASWHHGVLAISAERGAASLTEMADYDDALTMFIRDLPGFERIYSHVEPGKASALVRFSSLQALEAALADLTRWPRPLGMAGSVSLARAELPAGSPIRSGAPLPIEAVVSLGGLPDLEEAARPPGSGCGTEVIARIAGDATSARPDVYADTSVPRLAPLGIPQVLINGRQDRIIPIAYAEKYQADMRKAGDPVRVRMIDRTGHVELVAPYTAAWAAAVEEIGKALGR